MELSETWLPVVGREDHYEVSDAGRVRRVKAAQGTRAGLILKPIETKHGGYLGVHLHGAGKRKFVRIHRLVAEAFLGPSELPLVRHIDGNPKNNVPANLAHGTPAENAADRVAHGRSSDNNQNAKKTHCIQGHEFTPDNTRLAPQPNGRPTRICRECQRANSKAWEARRSPRNRSKL